jgi:hypothetical protein
MEDIAACFTFLGACGGGSRDGAGGNPMGRRQIAPLMRLPSAVRDNDLALVGDSAKCRENNAIEFALP